MAPRVHIETQRLLLRDWTDADARPFVALNADPRVMEFFPAALDEAESTAFMARIRETLAAKGYGLYAVEAKSTGAFIGYAGLAVPEFDAPFMPAVEIGWRLARESWGNGYATEAAAAIVDHAFRRLGVDALVAFTAEWNTRSRRLMAKIGMTQDPADDFDHPRLPIGHKLRRHALYRIDCAGWRGRD